MQTYQVRLVVTGGISLPTFSITAISPQKAVAKVIDIVDSLGGLARLESGYIVDRDGDRRSIC